MAASYKAGGDPSTNNPSLGQEFPKAPPVWEGQHKWEAALVWCDVMTFIDANPSEVQTADFSGLP